MFKLHFWSNTPILMIMVMFIILIIIRPYRMRRHQSITAPNKLRRLAMARFL